MTKVRELKKILSKLLKKVVEVTQEVTEDQDTQGVAEILASQMMT